MFEKFVIEPLIGIQGLKLGITRNEVQQILGSPEKCSIKKYEQDNSTDEKWEYLESGLELTFYSDDNWLLGTISITSKEATLKGFNIIGLSEEDLLATLQKIDIMPTILKDDFSFIDSRDYVCDKYCLSFWVQDGVVSDVTIYPEYDKSGNVPLWPK